MSQLPPASSFVPLKEPVPSNFDEQKAANIYRIALLPQLYVNSIKDQDATQEQASQLIRDRVASDARFEVIQHKNIVAVIVSEPSRGKITVAYNPSKLETTADQKDNLDLLGHKHPLGGHVHSGYFKSYNREGGDGLTMGAAVRAQVEKYVAEQIAGGVDKVNLIVTGISRGGALAQATAADWFQNGLPGGDNARFSDVQMFMPVALGDRTFADKFMQEAIKHGTEVKRVIILGDYLTNFNLGRYHHVGEAVYFVPAKDGLSKKKVLINPTSDELQAYLASVGPFVIMHDSDKMAKMLSVDGINANAPHHTQIFYANANKSDDSQAKKIAESRKETVTASR